MDKQPNYRHEDGLKRNLLKLRYEFSEYRKVMKWYYKDWFRKPWDSHHYIDISVEGNRRFPYLTGHWQAVVVNPTWFILLGLLIWRW